MIIAKQRPRASYKRIGTLAVNVIVSNRDALVRDVAVCSSAACLLLVGEVSHKTIREGSERVILAKRHRLLNIFSGFRRKRARLFTHAECPMYALLVRCFL
jgi:hypothetical protein